MQPGQYPQNTSPQQTETEYEAHIHIFTFFKSFKNISYWTVSNVILTALSIVSCKHSDCHVVDIAACVVNRRRDA
jgi:hypothetical protein